MTKFFRPYVITLLVAASASICAGEASAAQIEVDPVLRERLAQNMAEIHEHIDRFDAQVWLQVSDQRLQRYLPRQDDRLKLLQLVYMEATRQQLNPNLVLAVMQIESAFNQFAISSVGAQGLMQVMPFWRLEIGRPQDNLTHVETNIRYGTVILAHYIEVARGDLVDALARYNGSRGRLKYPEKVIGAWRKTWRNQSWNELPLLRASCANYPLRACRYQ
jgi:soluble lytic murein transglycosylase-like protein